MRLDFWFDYSCPYAYLGSTQVEALAARTGAELQLRPMLLGGVFKAVETPQNLSEVLSPQKSKHNLQDMQRWADVFGVTLKMPSGHPMRTVDALRATLATRVDPKVMHGFYRAYWIEGRPPSERETIREVVAAAGHDPDVVIEKMQAQAIKDDLRKRTDEAIALGIFGAPSFVVDGKDLFWGQDRMHFVERALGGEVERTIGAPRARKTLDVYWDFSSPFSYLGCTQAETLARRAGAELVMRPMLLGALFKQIGTADAPMLTWSPAKQRYTMLDLERWAAHWGVPFRFPSRFPMSSVKALRAYLAMPEDRKKPFRDAVYRAYWGEDRDIADDAVLAEMIGVGARDVLERSRSQEIKDALFAATRHAVDAGVFGAPTFVVDGTELFWGQDRVELVERALAR